MILVVANDFVRWIGMTRLPHHVKESKLQVVAVGDHGMAIDIVSV